MNWLSNHYAKGIIKQALKEDLGEGDITTKTIIPRDKYVKGILLAKQDCVICGLGIVTEILKVQDKNIKFKPLVSDGQKVKKGRIIASFSGRAQSILSAERVTLNFLSLLSGVASKTRRYVDMVKPYKVKILDTRKTIPGLRELEKYAVRTGGGYNHRMKLDDMVLLKDNHIQVACLTGRQVNHQSLKKLIEIARKKIPKSVKLEIEVNNLKGFKDALKGKPDIIMLDNMKVQDMAKAVNLRKNSPAKIEVSGNVNLSNIRTIARTGVDMISVGALTHSVEAVDISLEIL